MTRGPLDARLLAGKVLARVIQEDAYAAPVLSHQLDRSGLSAVDRSLATELTYGVLRTEKYLRRRLEKHTRLGRAQFGAQLQLLIGTYQIDFLERVPPHAIVSEAVRLTKIECSEHAAGFVNAVLRRVIQDAKASRLSWSDAVMSNVPSWLRKRLIRDVGEKEAMALLVPQSRQQPTLRGRPGRALPAAEGQIERIEDQPLAYRYLGGGDPRKLAGFARGNFVVQELGSQIVARLLGVRPGERVLDVCAGRGMKSSQLLDAGAQVVATELYGQKLSELREEMHRLGFRVCAEEHDWTEPPPEELRGAFDAVLVDAPCTGIGTLRRRPEILRRLTPDSPQRLGKLQAEILRNASLALAPGGRLLFATCSVLREEGEAAVEAVRPYLVPRPFPAPEMLSGLTSDQTRVRLLPGVHDSDGYFVAALELDRSTEEGSLTRG